MFPRGVLIYLTDQCQLSCIHCGIVNRYGGLCLKRNIFNKAIKLLYDNKCYVVALSGGDPILHPHLFEYIDNIRNNGMLPVLGLSGVGLEDADILRLKNSGIGCIQVSLDGNDEQTNSILRGKGNFEEIRNNIYKMLNKSILVNIATCICHENVGCYKEILEMFVKMGIYEIKVQCWEPPSCQRLALTPLDREEKRKVLEITNEFKDKYNYHNRIYLDVEFLEEKNTNGHLQRFILFPNGDVGNRDDYGGHIIGNILFDYEKIRRYYNE